MILSAIISALAPLVKDEVSLLWNFKEDVENLSSTLSTIEAVLEDADKRTGLENDKQMKNWLQKLKREGYVVRDIVDDWTFEHLRLQVKRLNASSSTRIKVTNYITHPFGNTEMRRKIGKRIKEVQEKLDKIVSDRDRFHMRESNPDSRSHIRPQTKSILSEKVYGRDMEKEKIVDILVRSSNVANEVSVLPILGPGGIGKTTLAQLVFNNDKVIRHFDPKIWVCVSQKFDLELILNAIIGATNETSLELLKDKVQDKLRGKRYFLVLDDVWNENEDEWKSLRTVLNCGSNAAFILTTTRKKIVAKIMKTSESFDLSAISQEDCMLVLKEHAFKHGIPKTENFLRIGRQIADICMGVPLVAKTLGAQLRFKNDENEWCTIRDSRIWNIDHEDESQNVEFILPNLKLSYYDLSYHLRRCFTICATFSKDTEIEKDRLIQLWIAHDLIPITKDRELEDTGNIIWDELMWKSFFQEEKLNLEGVLTSKMHDLMHDLAQFLMKDECYTMDAKSLSKDFEREIRHVTIMIPEFDKRLLGSLKNIGGLQSMKIYSKSYESVLPKEINIVLKELTSLRVFEVPERVTNLDLSCVRYFKHLRYLNLSGNREIKTLPSDICSLLNLQTLDLKNCSKIERLPKNLKGLINLRHLHLKGCEGLKYMPRGMGRLRNLKTLSLFPIGYKKSDHAQLDELKELDIRGYLDIRNLENVSDASIAKGISMCRKSSINELKLYWNDDTCNNQKKTRHEKIGEALEVSSKCLKRLRMHGYKGVDIPKWVGESSASLVELRLEEMDNVQHVFSMNNTASEIGMVDQLCPLLEELDIRGMMNLRELVSPDIITTGALFPNLRSITISRCPSLGALPPPCLKSLQHVELDGECSNELLQSLSNMRNHIINLSILDMDERTVLFPAIMTNEDEITSSSSRLVRVDNDETQAGGPSTNFQSLQRLEIKNCKKLRSLFDEEGEELAAAEGGQREIRTRRAFPNLTSLDIKNCPELRISSVEQWRNLISTPSLKSLTIFDCPKLVPSSKEEEALLRSLLWKIGREKFYVDFL